MSPSAESLCQLSSSHLLQVLFGSHYLLSSLQKETIFQVFQVFPISGVCGPACFLNFSFTQVLHCYLELALSQIIIFNGILLVYHCYHFRQMPYVLLTVGYWVRMWLLHSGFLSLQPTGTSSQKLEHIKTIVIKSINEKWGTQVGLDFYLLHITYFYLLHKS